MPGSPDKPDDSFWDSLVGFFTGGGIKNALGDIGNAAINYYGNEKAADAFAEQGDKDRDQIWKMYTQDVGRLEPFRQQLGIENLRQINDAADNNPTPRNMFAGQYDINPVTDVQGPTAGSVDVNQQSPFNMDDPGLKYLMDTGTKAITDRQVGKGKYNSGETMEQLQELGQGSAALRAGQLQNIFSQRDNLNLGADRQSYAQDLGAASFDLGQAQGNIGNQMGVNDQLYNHLYQANQFDQGADLNEFNQLSTLMGLGQNSAAGQGANTSAIANTLGQLGQNQGYANFWKNQQHGNTLTNLFDEMFRMG